MSGKEYRSGRGGYMSQHFVELVTARELESGIMLLDVFVDVQIKLQVISCTAHCLCLT